MIKVLKKDIPLYDKEILQMGLGLNNGGLGLAKFIAPKVKKLIITDIKTKEELLSSVEQLNDFKNIEYHLGYHDIKDFENASIVLKGAGIKLTNQYIQTAIKNGAIIDTDIGLFFEYSDFPILAVTGSKGKSSTTSLLFTIISNALDDVIMGGNIAINPLLYLDLKKRISAAVLELSSWQLADLALHKKSPHIAVLTTIFPDHLNYYDSMEDYYDDKKNIFRYQKDDDYAIINIKNKYLFTSFLNKEIPSTIFLVCNFDEKNFNDNRINNNYPVKNNQYDNNLNDKGLNIENTNNKCSKKNNLDEKNLIDKNLDGENSYDKSLDERNFANKNLNETNMMVERELTIRQCISYLSEKSPLLLVKKEERIFLFIIDDFCEKVKNFYTSIAEYNNIVENLESQDIENFLEPLVDKNMIKKIKVFQLREPYNENIFAEHGKTNMLLAIAASIAFDLNIGKIFEGIKKYAGLPYRMQVVGRKNNIEFINDTTATVPEAVAASILALAKSRNIVLIAGGVDKKLPANSMVRAIVENVCRLYLLEGSGSQLIEDELLNLNYLTFESGFRDLKQLVEKIFNDLKRQDASLFTNIDLNKPIAILLSPGFASFNLFINEFNRGDIFNDAVQKLISQK
ncbi:MAG: hypothetical protein KBB84_00880 [Spirochaetes bacterium]|nr:hypothetical protein [Spirochaetota bacterium]